MKKRRFKKASRKTARRDSSGYDVARYTSGKSYVVPAEGRPDHATMREAKHAADKANAEWNRRGRPTLSQEMGQFFAPASRDKTRTQKGTSMKRRVRRDWGPPLSEKYVKGVLEKGRKLGRSAELNKMSGDTEGVTLAYKKLKNLVTDLRQEGHSHLASEVSLYALEGKKSVHTDRDPSRAKGGRTSRDPSPRRAGKTKLPRAKQKWISEKIRLLMHEGKPQAQAIAIAYRMAGVPPRPKSARARKTKKATRKKDRR